MKKIPTMAYGKGMEKAFSNLDELERQVRDLSVLPCKFNTLFSVRSWIICDIMNVEVAKVVGDIVHMSLLYFMVLYINELHEKRCDFFSDKANLRRETQFQLMIKELTY